MTPEAKERLNQIMAERGMNAKTLAEAAGLGGNGVYDILSGKSESPRLQTINKLARALGVSASWLATGDGADDDGVPVVGYVSAGEGWTPIDEPDAAVKLRLAGTDLIAVEIRGDSMHPVYRDGDVLVCRRKRGRDIDTLIKQDCVVETNDGSGFVKILRRGTQSGLYTLTSYNRLYEDIENVSLVWAAPILWIKRGP